MSEDVCSNIFIPEDKQSLFILIFEDIILSSFHILTIFGPAREDKFCEVKFTYIGGDHSFFPNDAKMAKEYLKQNQHLLYSKSEEQRQLATSSIVPEIITLDDDVTTSRSKSHLVKTVDLTESEPELIVLDDTVTELNKTISGLNISHSGIDLEMTDLNKTSCHSQSRRSSHGSEVEFVCVKTSNKQLRQISPSCKINSSPIKVNVLNSNFDLQKSKHENVNCSNNLMVKINSSGLRSVESNGVFHTSKRDATMSPSIVTSKKKKSKKKRNICSKVMTPATKPLTDNVLKYYSKLSSVVKNIKGRKGSPKCKRLQSSIQTHQGKQKRSHLGALQNHNVNLHRSTSCQRKPVAETNIFNPNPLEVDQEGQRPVIIDGSNVARGHGKGSFSVKGIQICVDYFARRNNKKVKVFLPLHCQNNFTEKQLADLRTKCDVVFTPSMFVNGIRKTSYDDRFIVQYAVEFGGVIVSTDNYRDLLKENPRWQNTIENRLLMFTWVDDVLMFPVDPLGLQGPTLEQFLRF